jgi:signal transduction histidine kinase
MDIINSKSNLNYKYILDDSVRLIVSIFFLFVSQYFNKIFFIVSIFTIIYSLSWLLLNLFYILNYNKYLFLTNIPAIIDCLGISCITYLTGNVNSIIPIFFIGILAISSLGAHINSNQSKIIIIFSNIFYFVSNLLVYYKVMESYNFLNPEAIDIELKILISNQVFLIICELIIYNIVKGISVENQNNISKLNQEKHLAEKTLLDLQETQSQLIEAERMASLGQLVGGVAHEINNPIGVIRSNSELIAGNMDSLLKKVPKFLESLSSLQKDMFYSMVNESIRNKEFLTTKEGRAKRKAIKQELTELLSENIDNLDYLSEQILTLKLTSPFQRYVVNLGETKFIESLSIAQIFCNQFQSIGNIEIAVEKATRVIFALRSYLEMEMFLEKKEVDLIIEIDKALRLYDNYIMGKINIHKDYPKELKYTCTAENISQVWRHLIFNAIQAMYLTEKKLEIRVEIISVLPERLGEMQSSAIVEVRESDTKFVNNKILVSIVDSGHGIPLELQDKIFTPFFTTKALGEGIGLGLYASKKFVHEHGGKIYFASKEGRTEFCVVLPM